MVAECLALHRRVRERNLMPLLEVRAILDSATAGLAAEKATEEDQKQMETILHREADVLESHDEYVESDLRFHEVLMGAT